MIKTSTNYSLLISCFLFIIAIVSSYYFYKTASVSRFFRYFLTIIKTLAIFLLLFLFLEPSFFSQKKIYPAGQNIFLADNSRSNELTSTGKAKKETQIKTWLKNNQSLIQNNNLFTFSVSEAKPVKDLDSINFNGYESNLTDALSGFNKINPEQYYNSITILSDGCFNAGGNPLYKLKEFNAPVFTIGIGDSIQQNDIVIDKVLYNEKSFINIKNTIKAFISAYGYNDQNITVNLSREGNIISTKNIYANSSNFNTEIDFDIIENKAGIVKYCIEADKKQGELTYKNNRTDFLIKYSDNKVNILYISSGPGYDNSFILDILKRVNNYKLTTRVLKSPGEYYEGPVNNIVFGDLSLIFMLGFPSQSLSNENYGNFLSKIKNNKIPVVFFAEKNTDYKKLDELSDMIPFSITRSTENESMVTIQSTGNEIMKENLNGINNTSQIFKNVTGIIPKAGSVVLATDKVSGEPILIMQNNTKIKSTAFLGYGIWRWALNDKMNNEKIADNFILGIINETILKEKKEKLNVNPLKPIFDYTENIILNAEVFDDNFQPVASAKVTADILNNGVKIKNSVEFQWSNNLYTATIPSLPAGDYAIEAKAELNNNLYSTASSRFLVDSLNKEYLITKSDFDALKTISLNTGGQFFKYDENPDTYKESLKNIEKKSSEHEIVSNVNFNLRENKYCLIFIIILFAADWFFRKRNNIS